MDDELLYSWLARCRDLLRLPTSLPLLERMLSVPRLAGSVAMPMGISRGQAGQVVGSIDCRTLLMQHTAYPYYASFMDRKTASGLAGFMLDGCMKGSRQATIMTKVLRHSVLLFCSRCRERDMGRLGQAAWYRTHQMPGVFRCHAHDEPLLTSDVSAANPSLLRCCPSTDVGCAIVPCGLSQDIATRIARLTEHFLQEPREIAALAQLRVGVTDLLRASGWLHDSGHVRAGVWDAFSRYFGEMALDELGCGRGTKMATSWIHDIVGAHSVSHHPLKYLLLFDFLGATPHTLVSFPPSIDGTVSMEAKGSLARPRVELPTPSDDQMRTYRAGILSDVAGGLTREEVQAKHARRFRDMMAFDRTWLDAIVPPPLHVPRGMKDTTADDHDLIPLIEAAIERLRAPPDGAPPKRITIAGVASEARLVSFCGRKLRYPQSLALVEVAAQTVEEHRIAVLEWVARQYLSEGGRPNFKVFAKRAAFHPERFPALRDRARAIHEALLQA